MSLQVHSAENAPCMRHALEGVSPVELQQLEENTEAYVIRSNLAAARCRNNASGWECRDRYGDYEYNTLLKRESFWEQLSADTVLVFQTDAVLLGPGIDAFLHHSFIGAPWQLKNLAYRGVNEHGDAYPRLDRRLRVGNGGLSLRSVAAMRAICAAHGNTSVRVEPEDAFFARHMEGAGYRTASLDEASLFATETQLEDRPPVDVKRVLALHQAWKFQPWAKVSLMLARLVRSHMAREKAYLVALGGGNASGGGSALGAVARAAAPRQRTDACVGISSAYDAFTCAACPRHDHACLCCNASEVGYGAGSSAAAAIT
jgi:hypothetical protein